MKRFTVLCTAILKTGDGTSEHPYIKMSDGDGEVIINLFLKQGNGILGSAMDKNYNFCEIIGVERNDKSENVYFYAYSKRVLLRD